MRHVVCVCEVAGTVHPRDQPNQLRPVGASINIGELPGGNKGGKKLTKFLVFQPCTISPKHRFCSVVVITFDR